MQVLLVEDNPDHAELITDTCVTAFGEDASISHYTNLSDGLSQLNQIPNNYDVALFDLKLPDSDIAHTMDALGELRTDIPLVILTSLNDTALSLEMIHKGIQDYLPKEDLTPALLERVCRYAIERKKQQLELENRTQDQQVFCQSLSHDFRAPIRNLSQLLQLLQGSLEEREAVTDTEKRYLSLMEQRLISMDELIAGLYSYLKLENSGQLADSVDLNLVLHKVVEGSDLLSTATISLPETEVPLVKGDEAQLYLLFLNLMENAVKYCDRDPEIAVNYEQLDQIVQVHIVDNGVGMDPAKLDKIFKPFLRLQGEERPGSGLGLAIAARIAENCGGGISVTSEPGEGSCFSVSLLPAEQ